MVRSEPQLERHVEDAEDHRRWGVRFVVPDRPGFGRSDPQPGRRVTPLTLRPAAIPRSLQTWPDPADRRDWQVSVGLGRVLAAMLPRRTAHWLAGEDDVVVSDHAAEVYGARRP